MMLFHHFARDGFHHTDCALEHLAAIHADEVILGPDGFNGGRGTAAPRLYVEIVRELTVSSEIGSENADVRGVYLVQDGGTGGVAEQHAGRPVSPVRDRGELLRADDQRALVAIGQQLTVGDFHRIKKPRAGGRDIETGGVGGNTEAVLHEAGRGGQRRIARGGGDDQEIDVGGGDPRVGQGGLGGFEGEV